MKYVFEDKILMPVCAFTNGMYMDFWTGKIHTGQSKEYIENKLKKKKFTIVPSEITIYELKNKKETIGYEFILNGILNYLDKDKQPFKEEELHLIKKQIMNGKITQELLWGEEYEGR